MTNSLKFPFVTATGAIGEVGFQPLLPLLLEGGSTSIAVDALLDTGASVNVLPYTIGKHLGLDWEQQKTSLFLTGNLASLPAKAIVASATIGHLPPVRLAFAWTQEDSVPVILGQVNFFMEFDVCFFRAQRFFELTPKQVF